MNLAKFSKKIITSSSAFFIFEIELIGSDKTSRALKNSSEQLPDDVAEEGTDSVLISRFLFRILTLKK